MTINYQLGKIYKLCPKNYDGEYIPYYGSTCKEYLSQRLQKHKCYYKEYLKNNENKKITSLNLFELYGIDNIEIILIENYPCNSKAELHSRERYYIENNNCVNKVIPTRTKKEYVINNNEKIKEREKKYYNEVYKEKKLEMVKNKNVNKILIEHKEFWSLSKMTSLNEVSCLNLSLNVRKMIIKSLVISLSNTCLDSQSFHDYFFESLLKPIEERFERLDSLKSVNAHNENYIKETVNLIETFNGIVGGASLSVITNLVPFILPRLKQGVKLLNLYHNYAEIVELILKMFFVVIENVLVHDDHIISGEIKNQIFKSFLDLIQVFSQQYSGI